MAENDNSGKKRPSADPTRSKILAVSQKLFAKKGFAGTSISDIATKANINQSLIYHHFGSKQALWRLVKQNLLENYFCVNDISFSEWLGANSAREFIQHYITVRFKFYEKNPDVQRMINWQRLEPNQEELKGVKQDDIERLCQKIKDFQDKGELTSDCEPELILVLLSTTAISLFSNLWCVMHDRNENEQAKLRNQYLTLIINSLTDGLATKKSEID